MLLESSILSSRRQDELNFSETIKKDLRWIFLELIP